MKFSECPWGFQKLRHGILITRRTADDILNCPVSNAVTYFTIPPKCFSAPNFLKVKICFTIIVFAAKDRNLMNLNSS